MAGSHEQIFLTNPRQGIINAYFEIPVVRMHKNVYTCQTCTHVGNIYGYRFKNSIINYFKLQPILSESKRTAAYFVIID
jgi:hypothetical protein